MLRKQTGFVRGSLLEQFSGPGEFNFVTVVEWESQARVEGAKAAVTAMHGQSNFDSQETFQRLHMEADIANYKQVYA